MDSPNIAVDPDKVVASLAQQNASLAVEIAKRDSLIAQQQQEITELRQKIDEFAAETPKLKEVKHG